MSLWTRITEALAALAQGEGLAAVFEKLSTPPEKAVAFAIAVIALSAKMAKADGAVTQNEFDAFQEVFHVPEHEFKNVQRVFHLAQQDVAGYEGYAAQIANMFPENTGQKYQLT